MTFDRRTVLLTGTWGLGALALPGVGWAQTIAAARGFTHAVASGEPGPDTMLLWTRYIPADGGPVSLRAEVSETADFAKVAAGGAVVTGPWRDHTAKVVATGLKPGTRYFYRFVAPDGTFSPVGRTKTLPDGDARRFTAAIFSCANRAFGFFNAYAHAAARDDLDLAIHLGDYLYEERAGVYPRLADVVPGREHVPANKLVHLADYRLRYASYRADPALLALHLALPMIHQRDDHEAANNAWEGGAEGQLAADGDWNARKAAAMQAEAEWLPIDEQPYKTYQAGTLATFFKTETRLLARSASPELEDIVGEQADPAAALKAFRDGAWQDPGRTMMGAAQEAWLAHALAASVRARTRWQVVGSGTIVGKRRVPAEALDFLRPDANEAQRARARMNLMARAAGLPSGLDTWNGFPAARRRFLGAAQAADANLLVVSGDSHNAWAYDLANNGRAAGVEFSGQSVSSPGMEFTAAVDPARIAAAWVAGADELRWADAQRRGYMTLALTPERAVNDWWFTADKRVQSSAATLGHRATVLPGARRMRA